MKDLLGKMERAERGNQTVFEISFHTIGCSNTDHRRW